ncbi:MAG TPA: LytTR family DNA-binding domain-containing protein [Candidatus Nesterenkonia stercoripullorum]|uniref:LytTR family DNA-binding domain-containing protein n=1 Tax=Candidatus Nesterenkonia stercoripullorum TaxID=2838701 RepID=A0A9D1S285_9MICC|nr:LytTR family DNA-binding domain-containing protein [Candidatus Nesterenkonia stercoripullorum]
MSTEKVSTEKVSTENPQLRALVVDDEPPAIKQMQWLLNEEPLVRTVHTAANVAQARHVLDTERIDVVLLDIHMPGHSGLDLARDLTRDREAETVPESSPQIIFVTADAQPAVEAFELRVRDYLLKPVRAQRLHEALRRVAESSAAQPAAEPQMIRVSVLQGDSTLLLPISSIRWAQAQGDYARLHTEEGSYLLRASLADLEEQWGDYGFVRIHRSHVANLNYTQRVLHRQGRMSLRVCDVELPVSRRLMPHVRERLEEHRLRSAPRNPAKGPA